MKQSQAAVQNLHMSEENQGMIQGMLEDLQVDCVPGDFDEIKAGGLQRDEKYWGKVGDQRLQVESVTVHPDLDTAEGFSEEANQFAIKRLMQCGFEKNRCLAALSRCDDNVGEAVEDLVCACCNIKNLGKDNPEFK